MTEPTISVKNICKEYRLYSSPSDRLKEVFFRSSRHQIFKALNKISFDLYPSEFIGIIGRNGSGKSTLLKLITGIAQPSSGNLSVRGKISALLELGAGFNPEMTGIENIYFAGTIMGYSKKELDSKLDEIITFADIGDYIKQPVKTYSSGMFVRVAFSLAINVEPEILLVDEALSVGDIRFQQKCLRKIQAFKESGKTILFVSHDLGAVKNFCDRAIWLNDGEIKKIGEPEEVVKDYISFMSYDQVASSNSAEEKQSEVLDEEDCREWEHISGCSSFGKKGAEIEKIYLANRKTGKKPIRIVGGEKLELGIKINSFSVIKNPLVGFVLNDRFGNQILGTNTEIENFGLDQFEPGSEIIIKFSFIFPRLTNGHYQLSVAIADGEMNDHAQEHWVHDALILHVDNYHPSFKLGPLCVLDDIEISILK